MSDLTRLLGAIDQGDPQACPKCRGRLKIIDFIERRQRDVIERILRHCGLWQGPIRTLPGARALPDKHSDQDRDEPRELQLVLDPEYL